MSSLSGDQGDSQNRASWKEIVGALKGASCAICLTPDIKESESAVLEMCLHAFCDPCITTWSIQKPDKPTCPICRSPMRGCYFGFDFTSQTFRHKQLSNCLGGPGSLFQYHRNFLRVRRDLGVDEDDNVYVDRMFEWRRSIYRDGLQAVPESTLNHLRHEYGDIIMRRESYNGLLVSARAWRWIQREFFAILPDIPLQPDLYDITNLANSLLMKQWRNNRSAEAAGSRDGDNFLEPLRPFLHDKTNLFWHELTCFVQSPLDDMNIYDAVVDYQPSLQMRGQANLFDQHPGSAV